MESQRHKSIVALTADCDDASFDMIEKELFHDVDEACDCSDSSDDRISFVLQYQADILDGICTSDATMIEKELQHVSQACLCVMCLI